ncbi:hypothetical protein J2W46_004643 [Paraburkholderia strydomiana]|nr:IS66 family insertion sequence element accessory protein TnpB [Paraburkholderia strydomiana]MDR7007716.1 hypothetical protein [Paraburkholderia strydomiana]
MFRLDDELKVYVHRDAVDFRKSINGLAASVEQSMKRPIRACGLCVQQSAARPHQDAAVGP